MDIDTNYLTAVNSNFTNLTNICFSRLFEKPITLFGNSNYYCCYLIVGACIILLLNVHIIIIVIVIIVATVIIIITIINLKVGGPSYDVIDTSPAEY